MNNRQMMGGMPNAGGPVGGTPLNASDSRILQLNTYIYDYLIRRGFHSVARAMLDASKQPSDNVMPLQTADQNVNGVDGPDSKEDVKRPADLPEPGNKIGSLETCFLEDWWCQFWDLYAGMRGNANPALSTYIRSNQEQIGMRQRQQNEMVNNNVMANTMMYGRMQNGMGPNELRQAAMMGNAKGGAFNPNMIPPQMRMKMQEMRQNQNQNMGEQRSQSPSGNGDAPSPKRQRMEGAFNGQQMGGPAGRGQGMPGQNGMGGPNGMPMLQNGMPDSFNQAQLAQMKMGDGQSPMPGGTAGDGGNHALQDYQMQLMLLEQQNKKRLLMARQEQDNMGPNSQAPMGQFAGQGLSPSNSRQGPSPNPQDQMKRGTPQMGQKGLPPGSSPAAMEGMPNQFFNGMNQPMRPSSHPQQFPPNMTQQQMEMMRQQQQAVAAAQARGQFPGQMAGQPGQQPGQPGQPGQQPQPMGTPRQQQQSQPQGAMPPPPAPANANEQKTNPSSPNQNGQPAPPTPNTQKGSLPKGGKKDKPAPAKKAANKKNQGNTGATPASEAEPPTPTPSTPITPMHAQSFNKNGQPLNANAHAPAQANGPNAIGAVGMPNAGPQANGGMESNEFDPNDLNLANLEPADMLDNFDFDTFLNNAEDTNFGDFMDFGADGPMLAEG